MDTTQEIAVYLIQALGGIYVFLAIMRVLLPASGADYYNPISQFVVKATQLPVNILGKAVPSWKRIDLAAIVWVLLVQILLTEAAALSSIGVLVDPVTALAWACVASLHMLLSIIFWGMVILIVFSFAAALGGLMIQHPALDLLQQLMAPLMRPLQKILPPMGGLDLSPILLFLLINVLQIITTTIARNLGLNPALVVGF